jgi:hypothetical protein
MAFERIDDLNLYGGLTENAYDCYRVNKWMTEQGYKFQHMFYHDEFQCNSTMDVLNTWFDLTLQTRPITQFPVLVYLEVDPDLMISQYKRRFIQGADNIIAQLPALWALGRTS